HPITDAISDATATIAKELGARLIVTSTWSGYTARQVARERPREPIMAFTPNEATYRRLALTWGVKPVLVPQHEDTDEMIETMARTVLDLRLGQPGELVVITGGIPLGVGRTNFLKVHRL
ncbi:pyruvate kinase, partial [Candidatus Bipolaricaulota bacterium]|nr:pyruvate kinase [Candidatus Bipolaricaulota bacterium]